MGDQTGQGDFDQCLRRGNTTNGGTGDTFCKQAAHQLIGQKPQLRRPDWPGDHHIRHPIAPCSAGDLGFFCSLGKRCDTVDCGLHIIARTGHVPAGFEINCQIGPPLARGTCGFRNAVHRKKRRFQYLYNGAVHIFGPCPFPGHVDTHRFHDHIGKELRPHIGKGRDTKNQEHHQQKIGSRAMTGEVTQDSAGAEGKLAHISLPRVVRDGLQAKLALWPWPVDPARGPWWPRACAHCHAQRPEVSGGAPRSVQSWQVPVRPDRG